MKRQLTQITTDHVNQKRIVTVAGITGQLTGVLPCRDQVVLALIVGGSRVWTDAMPEDTEIEIEGKR